jgi:hypothetical protein
MTATAKSRLDAIRASIAARRAANSASTEELEIADLPDEETLDASWDDTIEHARTDASISVMSR